MTEKQVLKAITLHRPWAWAITHLDKRVENRTWKCPLPGGSLFAIHAGKSWDMNAVRFIESVNSSELITMPPEEEHPRGIVAIARFDGNVWHDDSPWFMGGIGWLFSDVVVFDNPVTCLGRERLWKVPENILPNLRKEYAAAKKREQQRMGSFSESCKEAYQGNTPIR